MKRVKLLLFSVVLLIAIVIAILSCTSKIQDVTLATNDIFEFNEGWQLEKEDTTINIEGLPYYGKASKGVWTTSYVILCVFICVFCGNGGCDFLFVL